MKTASWCFFYGFFGLSDRIWRNLSACRGILGKKRLSICIEIHWSFGSIPFLDILIWTRGFSFVLEGRTLNLFILLHVLAGWLQSSQRVCSTISWVEFSRQILLDLKRCCVILGRCDLSHWKSGLFLDLKTCRCSRLSNYCHLFPVELFE